CEDRSGSAGARPNPPHPTRRPRPGLRRARDRVHESREEHADEAKTSCAALVSQGQKPKAKSQKPKLNLPRRPDPQRERERAQRSEPAKRKQAVEATRERRRRGGLRGRSPPDQYWCRCRDLNPGHCGYEPHALTTEL